MFNPPTPQPQFYFLYFFAFSWSNMRYTYLIMELDCQTKRDLEVKQMHLFLFLFSFSTPRKKKLQLYSWTRRIRKREKCIWRNIQWLDVRQRPQEPQRGIVMKPWCTKRHTSTAIPFEVRKIITPHFWIYSTTTTNKKKEEGARIYSFGFKMYVL